MQMKKPPHPGLLVKNELEALGVSVAEAAKALGITRQQLYNVINAKSAITPEMAVRLAKGIGSTADTWLSMQQAYDLSRVRIAKITVAKLAPRRSGHEPKHQNVS